MTKRQKHWSATLLVFFIFSSIFLVYQLSLPALQGVDAYYHARHSERIAQEGTFSHIGPWVTPHFLSEAPADPYVLHHYLTGLLIRATDTMTGIKIIAALQAGFIFALFYFFLVRKQIKKPWLWVTVIFASSYAFFFRMLLERPFVISIGILMLLYYLLQKKRYIWAFALSAVYILFYQLAPLAVFLALFFVFAQWWHTRKITLKPLIVTAGGLLFGLVLHPQTFELLNVMYISFIKTFYLKLAGIHLPTGVEINVGSGGNFIFNNNIALIAFVIAVAAYFFLYLEKKATEEQTTLFLFSGIWFLVAVFIPRGVEYWFPFAWILVITLAADLRNSRYVKTAKRRIQDLVNVSIVRTIAVLVLGLIMGMNLSLYTNPLSGDEDARLLDSYAQVASYIEEHSAPGDVVFYPNWSLFPFLFYHNQHNRYVAAFDPMFLYEFDESMYWTWSNISRSGIYCTHAPPCTSHPARVEVAGVEPALRNIFEAKFIVLRDSRYSTTTPAFELYLQRHPDIYEESLAIDNLTVYKIKEPS